MITCWNLEETELAHYKLKDESDMERKERRASILLTLAAVIWGLAFVAQRVGSQYVGSFTFTGVRFALGALSLLPLIYMRNRKEQMETPMKEQTESITEQSTSKEQANIQLLRIGVIAGILLFAAASLQQFGLIETTAGKGAFITGFYIILVPLFGVFLKHKLGLKALIASLLALVGLYFISVNGETGISKGDLLIFLSSFFFAFHILLINKYSQTLDTLKLSFVQYSLCSIISLIAALLFEGIILSGILEAAIPILYGGIFSVGIAYTLQVAGQKYARASHASIIMSLEAVFAVVGGALILGESMEIRGYIGCILMILAVLVSQYQGRFSISLAVSNKL